ncbi:MAG TPA: hypothetical protein VH396_03465 [Chitinophagaceae bacterium]
MKALSKEESLQLKNLDIVAYYSNEKYILTECLERIKTQPGDKFQNLVELAPDYN